jgi:hypothetical protein
MPARAGDVRTSTGRSDPGHDRSEDEQHAGDGHTRGLAPPDVRGDRAEHDHREPGRRDGGQDRRDAGEGRQDDAEPAGEFHRPDELHRRLREVLDPRQSLEQALPGLAGMHEPGGHEGPAQQHLQHPQECVHLSSVSADPVQARDMMAG